MAKFKFYGTLKNHLITDEVAIDGNRTVRDSLSAIADQHASLKETLYVDGTDTLHEYFVVIVNDEQAEFLDDGMETRLTDEDVVKVFPPVSGG